MVALVRVTSGGRRRLGAVHGGVGVGGMLHTRAAVRHHVARHRLAHRRRRYSSGAPDGVVVRHGRWRRW